LVIIDFMPIPSFDVPFIKTNVISKRPNNDIIECEDSSTRRSVAAAHAGAKEIDEIFVTVHSRLQREKDLMWKSNQGQKDRGKSDHNFGNGVDFYKSMFHRAASRSRASVWPCAAASP
jgi:hypothetical protein